MGMCTGMNARAHAGCTRGVRERTSKWKTCRPGLGGGGAPACGGARLDGRLCTRAQLVDGVAAACGRIAQRAAGDTIQMRTCRAVPAREAEERRRRERGRAHGEEWRGIVLGADHLHAGGRSLDACGCSLDRTGLQRGRIGLQALTCTARVTHAIPSSEVCTS